MVRALVSTIVSALVGPGGTGPEAQSHRVKFAEEFTAVEMLASIAQ